MSSADPQAAYALSPMQEGMLFHYLADGSRGLDVEQIVIDLPEDVDADLLHRAWQIVAGRHDALRTSFDWSSGSPVQRVSATADVPFSVHDWSTRPSETVEAEWAMRRSGGMGACACPLQR
jgi:hypothetical protein